MLRNVYVYSYGDFYYSLRCRYGWTIIRDSNPDRGTRFYIPQNRRTLVPSQHRIQWMVGVFPRGRTART
jgi:hypothetical protein